MMRVGLGNRSDAVLRARDAVAGCINVYAVCVVCMCDTTT